VAFWTDIFTLETWSQAEKQNWEVTGFPAPTKTKGGYSERMFARVHPGDVLLCYCKGPATRWVGALKVTGPVFVSDEPIWGLAEDGSVRFPWRFPVEPIVALDPARGIPGTDVASQLGFLRRLAKKWGVYLQRSLNAVPEDDGEQLVDMLRQPRADLPITVGRPRARPRATDAPERGPLEARAVPLQLIPGEDQASDDDLPEPRVHSEIQGKLRDIGIFEGYDVWVADRGTKWNGEELGTGCLSDLPVIAGERTRIVMRNIDVIWFRRGTGHPVRFFEIEHSTSVYSGLLRMNDVMIDFPITEAFIVGEDEKTFRKFEREIARRTFEQSGLIKVTQFLRYEQVRATWEQYRAVGAGSKDWGATPSKAVRQPPVTGR
jgi:hypothetical protein